MSVPYDLFIGSFVSKIHEYELASIFIEEERNAIVDGFLKRAFTSFKWNCKYDFFTTGDDEAREYNVDVPEEDLDEIVEIVSEGMLLQWMKPYLYKQENLENLLNTRDFTTYSPAELLKRIGDAYYSTKRHYIQLIREYSYNTGDLKKLHL